MTSLIRDRYHAIKEERDVYQQMQTHFTSEMNSKSELIQSSAQDSERMKQDLEEAREATSDAFRTIQRLLAVVAVSDDDLIDPSACDSIGPAAAALERKVNDMRMKLELQKMSVVEVLSPHPQCLSLHFRYSHPTPTPHSSGGEERVRCAREEGRGALCVFAERAAGGGGPAEPARAGAEEK